MHLTLLMVSQVLLLNVYELMCTVIFIQEIIAFKDNRL